jgi:hypothetical protein
MGKSRWPAKLVGGSVLQLGLLRLLCLNALLLLVAAPLEEGDDEGVLLDEAKLSRRIMLVSRILVYVLVEEYRQEKSG